MTRRITLILILILIIATGIWAYFSTENSHGAALITDKPPMPVVTYDDKSLEVYRGSFSWKTATGAVIADALAPYDIVKDKAAVLAKPGDSLNFSFPYVPQKAEVRIWNDKEVLHSSPSSGIISVPRFEGIYAIEINAEWKEGHGIYVIKLEVKGEDVSGQSKPKPEVYRPSTKLPGTSMSLEAIAADLFTQYLEHCKSSDIPEGQRIKDYKVIYSKLISKAFDQGDGHYTSEIKFWVRAAAKEGYWSAGNGEAAEDGWIKNKLILARISVKDDEYTLESFTISP